MVLICRPFYIEWIPFTPTNQCTFMATSSREGERAALIAPHRAGVADNVSSQDSRQFALLSVDFLCIRREVVLEELYLGREQPVRPFALG